MNFHIDPWDAVLLLAISAQVTVLAHLHNPKWKGLLLTLPIPFTVATLAVGRTVDATHVLGLVALLFYTHFVRVLHLHARLPIVLSIIISALLYCLLGWGATLTTPRTDAAFWTASAASWLLALACHRLLPHRREPGQRSPLPVWIKFFLVLLVVMFLIVIKRWIGGFMTVFPMVGVFASYEARRSLWTMARQIPILMMTMIPMMIVIRLAHERIGLGPALAAAWLVYLALMYPVIMARLADREPAPERIPATAFQAKDQQG